MVEALDLIEAWDYASGVEPAARVVALLSRLRPGWEPEAVARLSLGVRDAELLHLRQELFGDRMTCLTTCPECREDLEFSVLASLLLQQEREAGAASHRIEERDYRIGFRLPDSDDLAALSRLDGSSEETERMILSRCVFEARGPTGDLAVEELPADIVEKVAREMEKSDPLATVWFDLQCEACSHEWQSLFDIASLIWVEVDRRAATVLREVHALASAYGWTEHDVLRMSAARRARYLGMIGA